MDLTAEAVHNQLRTILSSACFARTNRLKEILRYVVHESLENRGHRLNAYSLAIDVFGRDESFNPQIDTIVRVQTKHLRDRLEYYYLTEGIDDPVKITIPKGTYKPMYHHGTSVQDTPAERPPLAGALVSDKRPRTPVKPQIPVEIGPFSNLSGDPLCDTLCQRLTGAVVDKLEENHRLRVLSSSNHKAAFNPWFVFSGTIQQVAQQIKISVCLLRVSTGSLVWEKDLCTSYCTAADTLDSACKDALARIIEQIAQVHPIIERCASNIIDKFTIQYQNSDHALRCAYQYLNQLTPELHATAREMLETALHSRPNSSNSWALLAWVYADEYRFDYGNSTRPPSREPLERALKAAKQAVHLDPDNGTAWLGLFSVYFCRKELAKFRSAGKRAIQLLPDEPIILACYGFYLVCVGDWNTGLPLVQRSLALNPHPPFWYYYPLIFYNYQNRQFRQALAIAVELDTTQFYWNAMIVASVYGQLGMTAEAYISAKTLLNLKPGIIETLPDELQQWNFSAPFIAQFTDGLRLAGLKLTGLCQIDDAKEANGSFGRKCGLKNVHINTGLFG